MGLKKYEIITVGSDKRVRALRSWQVQDRYVNIGDVGGIVYDEKTLSQDGACWLFRGNFNFPGARIGGDSIVDVGEAALSATGAPNVDILGTSTVVGSPTRFSSDQTAADAVILKYSDFEPGTINYVGGTNWETWKSSSPNYLRTKAPIFTGGVSTTLKLEVPGYTVQAYVLDRDGNGITATSSTNTGKGVTLVVPAGQYMVIRLAKNPASSIALSDVTTAQITFTGTYETKLAIIDSRVEINPATSAGTLSLRPGGTYTIASGAKYPDSVIQNSKVSMMVHATGNRTITLMAEFINTSAVIDASVGMAPAPIGIYKNVKNLAFSGSVTGDAGVSSHGVIQATDCDNFAVSTTIFPGLAAAQTANMPFIFQGCNVPVGRFYHHAQIANTYKNIDFAKASVDLGKLTPNGYVMASSEVEGMYRLCVSATNTWGCLVEAYGSVSRLVISSIIASYGTTIYADAYLNGLFDLKGTNVFGNAMKHDASNTQNVLAVQGSFNATAAGQTITGLTGDNRLVCVPTPFRINGSTGLTITNLPTGFNLVIFVVDANNQIVRVQGSESTNTVLNSASLVDHKAYIRFKKVNGDPITPDDVKGVTVTTYNGCKIVNTKETAATIAGNVRVEDNATLIDTSVTGTGYFGGNSIVQGLTVEGAAYVKDNAVFAPTISGTPKASILQMADNASFTGGWSGVGTRLVMSGNARFTSATNHNTLGFVEMHDNASISGSGSAAVSGVLVLQDDASITAGVASISGDITLCGKYTQTASKTWTGKRVIDSQDAPLYDNNVKTQYDF